MMLILVMAFFMLGCRFSCSGMKEDFAWNHGACNKANYDACESDPSCTTGDAIAQCTKPAVMVWRR